MLHERPPALGVYANPAAGRGTWGGWAKRTTRRTRTVEVGE